MNLKSNNPCLKIHVNFYLHRISVEQRGRSAYDSLSAARV